MTSLPENNADAVNNVDTNISMDHVQLKDPINEYTPAFWSLAIPALAARYVVRYLSKLYAPELKKYNLNKNESLYATLVGLWMTGITGYYTLRTYGDMKQIFRETLAWEFNKRPEEVGMGDFAEARTLSCTRCS